jgi:hypothetical protein
MDKRGTSKGADKGHRGGPRKGGPRKPDSRPGSSGKPAFRPASGSKPAFRPAVASKPADGKRPIAVYPDLDKRRHIEDAERAVLGRVSVLAGDAVALGCNSSRWPEFQEALRAKFTQFDAAKVVLADRIAAIWNKNGFKTGAGQQWTARLVDVARKVLAEAKPAEPEVPPG